MPCRSADTPDTLFNGRLFCRQPAQGYRFSIDAVLLAHFCRPAAGETVVDLGAGCGVVSLILAYRHPGVALVAVEAQEELARCCAENARANSFTHRLQVVAGDVRRIRELLPPESCQRVVCNPPYGQMDRGRVSPNPERRAARHEGVATVEDFAAAAAFVLRNRCRAAFVFSAARLPGLLAALRRVRLEPKVLRLVHSYPGADASLVLVEAIKNGGEELRVLPPLYVYREQNGAYSEEVAACYAP